MFKDNLISLRKIHGYSQDELAEKIGVTRQTLSKYETGESLPDIERCKRLADIFGVSMDDLVNYEKTDRENLGLEVPPKGKHVFGMVKVGDKGQIVIPANARKIFDIQPGDNLLILGDEEQGIAILKEKSFLEHAAAQEVNVPSCISCYLGVTEPAMFGVNLKFHFPFICGMIGSAIAAVVCVATSTTANAIGVGGIPGILSIQPAYMLSFALCMAIAIVVPFVLTVIVGKKKGVA